jgi:hypothetical protein
MFNVCPRCGEYSVEKAIDPTGPVAICPACQYAYPFLQQPLFLITGASGSGKTTACLELIPLLRSECVILDTDILWGTVPATPEDDYRSYREMWLRVAKNIGQAGQPVALCGSAIPQQYESCTERRYFSTLHYLALVCEDHLLIERLQSRPAWRKSSSPEVLERMGQFNRWLKANASKTQPPMTLYDTSYRSVAETAAYLAQWIRERSYPVSPRTATGPGSAG